jgi:hypothetical protein
MTYPVTIVEPTTLLRDWLRGLGLSVDTRIYAGGLPQDPTFPAVVIYRVGGSIVDYQDDGDYQLDCLAATPVLSAQLAGEVASALISGPYPTSVGAATTLHGWYGVSLLPDYDPDPDRARTTVTAQATTITSTTP